MDFEFRNVKVYQGAKAFHSAIQTVIEQKKPGHNDCDRARDYT